MVHRKKRLKKGDRRIAGKGIAKMLQAVQNKALRSGIRLKLYAAFAIPIFLMAVFGLLSYKISSNAIITNAKISTTETMSATKAAITMEIDAVAKDAYDFINSEMVKRYYSKADELSKEEKDALFLSIRNGIASLKSKNESVYNIHIFGSKGEGFSTAGELPDNFYDSYLASEDGKLVTASIERIVWTGTHSYLDESIGNGRKDYSLSIIRKLPENNGFIIVDISENWVTKSLKVMQISEDYIVGLVVPGNKETLVRKDTTEVFKNLKNYSELTATKETGYFTEKYQGKDYLFLFSKLENKGAALSVLIPERTITEKAEGIRMLSLIFVVLACVLAAIIGTILAGGIATEIKKMTKNMARASKGDLTTEFTTKRKDEFQVLASSLNEMVNGVRKLIEKVSEVGTRVSNSANTLSYTSSDILASTKNISLAIEEIGGGVVQQASDTEICSNMMTTLSDKVNNVNQSSFQIEQIANSTKGIIEESIIIVNELSQKSGATRDITRTVIREIEELELKSRDIEQVISVINEIASQTNLLSLNASIEAARAGESGRGFAVVAEEIRKLAEQSVGASNRIKDIIRQVQDKTQDTVSSAKQARGIVKSQVEALTKTVTAFENINEHVSELLGNLNQITEGVSGIEQAKEESMDSIRNISAVSQQTAASAEEVSATAIEQISSVENLSKSADELAGQANELEGAILQFKI